MAASPKSKSSASRAGASGPYKTLKIAHRKGVDWLTLSRPKHLNAVNPVMAEELADYFDALAQSNKVRVVVMQGEGRHFCAGFDLDNTGQMAANVLRSMEMQRQMAHIVQLMRRCPQPIVALMHGAACGAGFALALAADVRYAAQDARMNVAMARIGLTGCDMGISYFLPRAVGSGNAAEMMMGGRFVNADRALRIGLVSDVVPHDALAKTGQTLVDEMINMSPAGLRLTKEGLAFAQDANNLDAVVAMEDRGQVLCMAPYMEEGVAAFREKRAPRYPK
ncbi:MAG: enoyl-CoA hydratase/isomerase family protein [Burkholderiaceae bacterium]|nr:enoyl-CoA hydratase/isomerase family protein [Burkholderiaceae bacterium]